MPSPLFAYVIVTLLPMPLLAMAAVFGGWWGPAALAYVTVFTAFVDWAAPRRLTRHKRSETDSSDGLLGVLAACHMTILPFVVWSIAHDGGSLSLVDKIFLFFAAGLYFGQVSMSAAHELIHRPNLTAHLLGKYVFISLLFGHHTSAHLGVHHRFVGTDRDPNTARLNQNFYQFAPQAWIGSFRAGWQIEVERLRRRSRVLLHPSNPYWSYLIGTTVLLFGSFLLAGWTGVLVYLLLAGYAQMQLLLSDYVQHYGLSRAIREDGKPEPVTYKLSWNAPHWFSALLMLAAPRHSEHHTNPGILFPALNIPETAPMLPYSLPVMAAIALWPPAWKRVMNARAAKICPPEE